VLRHRPDVPTVNRKPEKAAPIYPELASYLRIEAREPSTMRSPPTRGS
jgi:hypothetical protein